MVGSQGEGQPSCRFPLTTADPSCRPGQPRAFPGVTNETDHNRPSYAHAGAAYPSLYARRCECFHDFVSSSGADTNDCASPATACRHISRALTQTAGFGG